MKEELFRARIVMVVESGSQKSAKSIAEIFFHNFSLFKNLPLNGFKKEITPLKDGSTIESIFKQEKCELIFTPDEISRIYHFPKDPTQETALLKVSAKKLALPIGMPILPYTLEKGQLSIENHDPSLAILAESNYRSVTVPIGIYDEDRLRHMYVVGKTGVGKSKFLLSQMIDDIEYGKGIAVIDPHGDLIEEIMMHIPESRKNDVIIFDPTDEAYPFCFNPLSIKPGESRQILAKGFIDIFKKFF